MRSRVYPAAFRTSLALIAVVVAGACSSADQTESVSSSTTTAPPAQVPAGPFTISVESANAVGDTMRVSGTTNLPDASKLVIYLERAHTFPNPDDFAAYRQASTTTSVSQGSYSATFKIDSDDDWIATIASLAENPYAYGPLISVSDSLTVCVEFATVRDEQPQQPQAVLRVVGPQGENLRTSPQAQEFGSNFPPPSYDLVADGPLVVYPTTAATKLSRVQGNTVRVDKALASGC